MCNNIAEYIGNAKRNLLIKIERARKLSAKDKLDIRLQDLFTKGTDTIDNYVRTAPTLEGESYIRDPDYERGLGGYHIS